MSSIPASAMPHAKAHEPAPAPTPEFKAKAVAKPFPWLALAVGGALAVGTAITAAIVTRKPKTGTRRASARKSAGTAPRKPRRKKTAAG